ncbi:unnamed protein product [Tilletia controversa]|uniref:DNA endonuclease activator Ctp1 C-terminal domain-containing protein n=3 Tax=Tilletia TaxID=13289 RepID=A0A8X7MR32_9BASI|nr:hypothetical protein CF336_g4974 [Tilletia laevis]KAE8195098.1 hypothetical protein CF328_g4548 [Tilletia controversa]KAE8259002.1 hypothetical protein A4X03_0g4222 [Tilletia caries]KAE8198976.1 hypothetical protein CF335_g4270 [Tilletia laevis]KAE8245897.1 hypothetical protein A4X06_0g5343 [Tilletia controversa]
MNSSGQIGSPVSGGVARSTATSTYTELSALVQLAIIQNQQQYNDLGTLLQHAVNEACRESDARLHAIVEHLHRHPTRSMVEQGTATGSSLGESWQGDRNSALQEVDVNLPSVSQRSNSTSKAEKARNAELASRLAQVEQERDSIKEKYKSERKKQRNFKAWWEANLGAMLAAPTAQQGSEGSPLKKRRIGSPTKAPPALHEGSTKMLTPAKRRFSTTTDMVPAMQDDVIPSDALIAMSPRSAHATIHADPQSSPEKSSAVLRTSFANLQLSRAEKDMIRDMGLSVPMSPAKKVAELEPIDATSAAEQPFSSALGLQISLQNDALVPPLPTPDPQAQQLVSNEESMTASESSSLPSEKVETQLNTDDGWKTPSNAEASKTLDFLTQTVKRSGNLVDFHPASPTKRVASAPGVALQGVKAATSMMSTSASASTSTSTSMGPKRIRYDLDPALNRGEAYEYEEVIRGREARRNLIATECLECKEWYERAGPSLSPPGPVYLPYTPFGKGMKAAREERKMRESATASSSAIVPHHTRCRHHAKASASTASAHGDRAAIGGTHSTDAAQSSERGKVIVYQLTEDDRRQSHRQAISRHRNTAPPSSTPPGYWDIAFPSTQKVLEMNEEAEARREAQQDRLARDPRYRARSGR